VFNRCSSVAKDALRTSAFLIINFSFLIEE
jgi:hypothetical protein